MEFKFLQGAFGQVKPRAGSATEHAIAGTVAAVSGSIGTVFDPSRAGWDFDQATTQALEKVIWVFRCVDAIATNFAGLKLVGRRGDPYEGQIYQLPDPIDRLLNKRSNEYETSEEFRYRLMSQLLLSKRGAFIEIERDQRGDPFRLHLLPPHLTEPVPDPDEFVKEFRVTRVEGGGWDVVAKENVIWIKVRPHPSDPYLQMNPLMAAQLAVETDWLARLYNRNFLLKDGRPALLVAITGQLGRDTAKEMKGRLNGGVMMAGETIVVEADGLQTVDLGGTPHEAQWLEAISGAKADILLAFGTPESVLGNASGRTFDNADAEREGWWKDTNVPLFNRVARGLDPLTGDPNDDNFIANDFSKVDVLQRAIKAIHDKAAADFAAGLMPLDEYLEIVGKPKLNVPGARVHFLPNGLIVGKDDNDVKAASELPNLLAAQQAGGQQPQTDPSASAQAGALAGAQEGARQFNNEFAARIQRLLAGKSRKKPGTDLEVKRDRYLEDDDDLIEGVVVQEGKAAPYETDRRRLESELHRALLAWDQKQIEVITGRLSHSNILRYTRHWQGEPYQGFDPRRGFKALDPSKVVQVDRWKEDLKRDLAAFAVPATNRELRRVAQEMHASGITKVMAARGLGGSQTGGSVSRVFGDTETAEKAVADVLGPLNAIVDAAADRQAQRVTKRIREMDAAGSTISEIKAEVQQMIGTQSSWKQGLSEYLAGSAIEGIRAATYAKAGPIVKKIWVTVGDEHTRPTHRKVDQVEKPNNGKFKVGRYLMSHPGDPKAGPEETANCRCWTEFEIADKYADLYDELAA